MLCLGVEGLNAKISDLGIGGSTLKSDTVVKISPIHSRPIPMNFFLSPPYPRPRLLDLQVRIMQHVFVQQTKTSH